MDALGAVIDASAEEGPVVIRLDCWLCIRYLMREHFLLSFNFWSLLKPATNSYIKNIAL